MKPCPRCAGFAGPILVITEEQPLAASSCLNCGHVGGDALIEHHHGLAILPEPSRQLSTPIYDPTHRRLSHRQVVEVPVDTEDNDGQHAHS